MTDQIDRLELVGWTRCQKEPLVKHLSRQEHISFDRFPIRIAPWNCEVTLAVIRAQWIISPHTLLSRTIHTVCWIGHNASSSNPDMAAGFKTLKSYFLFFFCVDFFRYEVIDWTGSDWLTCLQYLYTYEYLQFHFWNRGMTTSSCHFPWNLGRGHVFNFYTKTMEVQNNHLLLNWWPVPTLFKFPLPSSISGVGNIFWYDLRCKQKSWDGELDSSSKEVLDQKIESNTLRLFRTT